MNLRLRCIACGKMFDARGEWQVRCYSCYKTFKAEQDSPQEAYRTRTQQEAYRRASEREQPRVVVQYVDRPDRDGVWLRSNIKELLHLCHPDKHGNTDQSNKLTRELIDIFKARR